MKYALSALALAVAAGAATLLSAAPPENAPWMAEMKKCAVCSAMADHPDLMQNMSWETHKIENGMLNVASVPKERKAQYDGVHAKMMENVAKAKADQLAGKPVELCGFCSGMGDLMKAGAKQENVNTASGSVCLVTSNDPGIVQKIHAQADKAIEMQKQIDQQASAAK